MKIIPRVRVFVPTFKRHKMLPRALKSLRSQTFKNWICEVHNDDPTDKFPEKMVRAIADSRIIIINHPKNQGGAATINAFYAPVKEEFISILEDDNWWEPEFLEEMLKAADLKKHVSVFWSNMKIWKEEPDGSFVDTKKTTVSENKSEGYKEYWWPSRAQILGAVHSNGACLIRSGEKNDYRIPEVPQATIEHFRERIFPQPLLLIRKPLANFSITRETSRKKRDFERVEALTALAATFFKNIAWSQKEKEQEFQIGKNKNPPNTDIFLNAALVEKECRFFFRLATKSDLIKWGLRHCFRPKGLIKILFSKKINKTMWEFLEKNPWKRNEENNKKNN